MPEPTPAPISLLPEADPLTGAEQLALEQAGTTVRETLDKISTFVVENSGLGKKEPIAGVNVSTDFEFPETLAFKPLGTDDVELFLNGVVQTEGVAKDYTVNITTKKVTWLAGTGTAVDLNASDEIIVFYRHNNVV